MMSSYTYYSLPLSTLHGVPCRYCHKDLKKSQESYLTNPERKFESRVVVHEGGKNHNPQHAKCVKIMHDAGHHFCVICGKRCNSDSLYPDQNRLGRVARFTQTDMARRHLPALAIGTIALFILQGLSETLGLKATMEAIGLGIMLGIFGSAGYSAISSRMSLRMIQCTSTVASFGLIFLKSVYPNLRWTPTHATGLASGVALIISDNNSALDELISWVTFAAAPLFAKFLGGSDTSILQTGLVVTTVFTMVSFVGTLLRILPLDQGIPIRRNSTPFRI